MTTIQGPATTAATVITEDAAAETTTVAGAQAAVDRGRQYIVLRDNDLGDDPALPTWIQVGSFDAASPDEAVRKAAADEAAGAIVTGSGVLTYVAVAARSFQPLQLTAKVEPKIEFVGR